MRNRTWVVLALACVLGACKGPDFDTDSMMSDDASTPEPELPSLAGCTVFGADDAWNQPVASAPVDIAYTDRFRAYLRAHESPGLHPDFGANLEGEPYGLPINIVPRTQPDADIEFEYTDLSDPGPWPIPVFDQVRLSGGMDTTDDEPRLLIVQENTCLLYEAWNCRFDGIWGCGIGARFDLARPSHAQRGPGRESTDVSGMPVLAGLVRHAEVSRGKIEHALRIGIACAGEGFVAPASSGRPFGSCTEPAGALLPVGLRLRLPADYDLGGIEGEARVIAEAMQTYGLIVSFRGSNLFLEGEQDTRWDDEALATLKTIPGTAFEVVGPVVLEQP